MCSVDVLNSMICVEGSEESVPEVLSQKWEVQSSIFSWLIEISLNIFSKLSNIIFTKVIRTCNLLSKRAQSSFPLIQPSFVKFTQLAQFAKTSNAWQYMELVIVGGISGTESSVAYLVEHQTYNPRACVLLPPKFWLVVKFFKLICSIC